MSQTALLVLVCIGAVLLAAGCYDFGWTRGYREARSAVEVNTTAIRREVMSVDELVRAYERLLAEKHDRL